MGTDQDESGGYQRQFNAAVSVIQNLPKNGSYKPSYDEMLRFYSYYKQATIGPCNISRPGFWDPIGRYKWDAWDKLGRMSRDDAMRAYINEMKMVAQKIINTFPLEEATPEMFEPFRTLYDVIPDMPRPPDSFLSAQAEKWKIEYGKNHNSDGENKQPTNLQSTPELQESGAHCGQGEARTTEPLAVSDGSLGSWGSGNEDFSDSLDRLSPDKTCEDESHRAHPDLGPASDVTHKRRKVKAKRSSPEKWKENDSGTATDHKKAKPQEPQREEVTWARDCPLPNSVLHLRLAFYCPLAAAKILRPEKLTDAMNLGKSAVNQKREDVAVF